MSRKIFITKANGQLKAFDSETKATIDRWKDGKTYALTYKEARNAKFHRMAFSVAQKLPDNAPIDSYW